MVEISYLRYFIPRKSSFDYLETTDSYCDSVFVFVDDFAMLVIHFVKSCSLIIFTVALLRFLEVFIAFFPRERTGLFIEVSFTRWTVCVV
ncbi:hypothetical protein D8S78_03360 [Natrialba swarupiae]|nr:hypothetical protein [Natrialba swarupiae]